MYYIYVKRGCERLIEGVLFRIYACSSTVSQPQTSSWGDNQLADPALVDSVDKELSSTKKKRSNGIIVFKTGKDFKT